MAQPLEPGQVQEAATALYSMEEPEQLIEQLPVGRVRLVSATNSESNSSMSTPANWYGGHNDWPWLIRG